MIVRPDYVIEVWEDVLKEVDGSILKYGLQALHNSKLLLPSRSADRPSGDVPPSEHNWTRVWIP